MSMVLVIGDLFLNRESSKIMTFSEFVAKAFTLAKGTKVITGLGLSTDQQRVISSLCQAGNFHLVRSSPSSPAIHTHKQRPENILLDSLKVINDITDAYELRIDSKNELVRDHVTGIHVSAMLGIEASRQATIASFERRYLMGKESGFAFSLISMRHSFPNFIFPFPTKVVCSLSTEEIRANRWVYEAVVNICQGKTEWTSVWNLTVAPRHLIRSLESRRFEETAETIFGEMCCFGEMG